MVRIGTITVTVNGERIDTRPTLRAAHNLNQHHGDVGALVMRSLNGRISALMDMIREGCADIVSAERFERAAALPLAGWHTPAVFEFASTFGPALLCVDLDALANEPPHPIERTPYNRVLADLFAKATGWLGWSSEEAWNATPGEIIAAVNAHVEKLKLMAGGSQSVRATAEEDDDGPDELDRAGLAELASMNSL